MKEIFDSLLIRSELVTLRHDEETLLRYESELQELVFPPAIKSFHPRRQREFKLGRLAASFAAAKKLGRELKDLPVGASRAPVWPAGIVGSLSHGGGYVAAAVAPASEVAAVGIDLEEWGRVKSELATTIMPGLEFEELKEGLCLSSLNLSEREILTIVFCAKEALYKALFPQVGHFFGFEAATCRELILTAEHGGSFVLTLTRPLGPWPQLASFKGQFARYEETLFSAIELLKT